MNDPQPEGHMASYIGRRKFLATLGGAAAAWPLAARAQQPALPVIGFLHDGSFEPRTHLVAAFGRGLDEAGFVDRRDVLIEYHWAQDQSDRLPAMAGHLVQRQVAVIATPGSAKATVAAKAATREIPIVFGIGTDPVKLGLVASLNRPGGNVTGVSYFTNELGPKRLGLLLELMAGSADVVMLANPKSATTDSAVQAVKAAATEAGRQLSVLLVSNNRELDAAFATIVQKGAPALVINADELFFSRRIQLVTLATRHAIPAIYTSREYVEVGGLMSYGANIPDIWRQIGSYAGRILKGAKPTDLPVVQPTRFEFVINLQTARTLGLEVPPTLLARADEVIE
jgi:putative tryptophan/tyrosine transport system substrate-binding protein